MKKALKFNILSLSFVLLLTLSALVTNIFGWFTLPNNTINTDVSGKLVQEYFHCGSGNEDDPFIITRPIHYYHMVEFFQRTTALPTVYNGEGLEVKFGDDYLYFQIGCPEEQLYNPDLRPETDENTEYFVFEYSSTGQVVKTNNINGNKTNNLNMAYYSDANSLMPVGTSEVPFYGQIDGKGLIVSNINIVAEEDVHVKEDDSHNTTSVTRTTSDVGIFGYVYDDTVIHDIYFDNCKITLNGAAADATINTSVTGISHESSHEDMVYVGYIAGHIKLSTVVRDVYINNSSIVGGAAAKSSYGFFGLVDNNDGTPTPSLGSQVADLRTQGDTAGLNGGSMDMLDLHTRLSNIYDASSTTNYYVTEESFTLDTSGNKVLIDQKTATVFRNPNSRQTSDVYRYYDSPNSGGTTNITIANGSKQYMCLYGASIVYPKTIYTYTYKDEYKDGFYLEANGIYLSAKNAALVNDNSSDNASVWAFDNQNHIYTYVVTSASTTTCLYYLNRNTNGTVSLSATASTVWNKDGNGNLYVSANGNNYLTYDTTLYNTGWGTTPQTSYVKIYNGTNYLSINGTTITNTNEANATKWFFNGSTGSISTIVNGTVYYLNNGLQVSTTNNSNWTFNNNNLYYTNGGKTFYLSYNNSWGVTTFVNGYILSNGNGRYLVLNNTGFTTSTNQNDATIIEYNGTNGSVGFVYNGAYYYFNKNGSIGTTSNTNWVFENNTLSYTDNNTKYYLYVYNNNFIISDKTYAYTIKDSNNNFLQLTNTVARSTTAGSELYYNGTNGTISVLYNGQVYYLNRNLGVSTTSDNTNWIYNGTLYYTYGGVDYYLACVNNQWVVIRSPGSFTVGDGTYYFNCTTTAVNANNNQANATKLYINSNGYLMFVSGGRLYYVNGTATGLSCATTGNTVFTLNGTTLQYTVNNNTYSIYREGTTWKVFNASSSYYYIQDLRGLYLSANGTTLNYQTTEANATLWEYNGTNGKISYLNGTTTYYLNNGTQGDYRTCNLATSSNTTWVFSNNKLTTNNRCLMYMNGYWVTAAAANTTFYTISSGGNYLKNNGTNNSPTNTTNQNDASLWVFTADFNSNGNVVTYINGSKYYLRRNSNSGTTLRLQTTNSYNTIRVEQNALCFILGNGNQRYLRLNGTTWQIDTTGTVYNVTNTAYTIKDTLTKKDYTPANMRFTYNNDGEINLTRVNYNLTINMTVKNNDISVSINRNGIDFATNLETCSLQTVEKSSQTGVPSGNPSYVPIISRKENNQYPAGYAASKDNTGYIISGAHVEEDKDNTASNQLAYGDIRVSYFTINNNITNSYSTTNNNFTTVYTIDSNGVENGAQRTVNIKTGGNANNYPGYVEAEKNMLATLKGQTRVYGLHFMNADISMDHIIKAEEVSIYGSTYYDYELPEDCIDFRLMERGYIAFFAGTYFTGNNGFFSLHQIFRNSDRTISDIKEIKKVYGHKTLGKNRPYVYLYDDGSYSDPNGIPDGYEMKFDTSWIANPTTLSNSYMYYFEIPANKGEYALGSASGKTGAYLTYLDIGTAGGDVVSNTISQEGNDIVNTFKVEFRSEPDKINTSILLLEVNSPEGATSQNFEIKVSFDNSDATCNGQEYENGLYTIYVYNKTGADVLMYIYLCDDDHDLNTDFKYAYRIVYVNESNSSETVYVNEGTGLDYYMMVDGFKIPSSGNPIEVNFQ